MNARHALAWLGVISLILGRLPARAGEAAIHRSDLSEWLNYIASDELEGRATFSAGLGLAAGYLQSHLARWGVKPAGDKGGYLQTVEVHSVNTTSRSSVTVRVGRESRTFRDGQGVVFPKEMGGKRTTVLDRVEFVGYGLEAPVAHHDDFHRVDVAGAAVVYLGLEGPKALSGSRYRRMVAGRSRHAVDERQAAAVIGPSQHRRARAARADEAESQKRSNGEFITARRLDRLIPPAVSADDQFYEFLFSGAPVRYSELKRKAAAQEPLPAFRLDDVTVTFTVDADYAVVRTQRTHNVVAIVEGGDPTLRGSYVAFGAHYDHVGYADREVGRAAPGRVTASAAEDRIWNGADDDGSGTVALLALAKAFTADGARPKRSLLFVWHAGEERGLWGSRYFVDHPTVPLDAVVAQLNVDMIGRNRDDDPNQASTVYLVGSDRISSELHDVSREANASLPSPLTLDYELNDPSDTEQLYYRSDHYSYASQGIPVIFFTTGLHPDYHANTDDVSKIEFDKLTRVTQLVYATGARLANLDHTPARDRRGPRAGKGTRE